MHLYQIENLLSLLAQLKVQLLELAFVHFELMLAGFERSRATEPIVGVFYIEGFHGCALHVLFVYTVIEAQPVSEGEATSCSERQISANSWHSACLQARSASLRSQMNDYFFQTANFSLPLIKRSLKSLIN